MMRPISAGNKVPRRLTFQELSDRLIRELNQRVRRGDFTERGLARLLGASQPHIHNVLKGVRRPSTPLADHILIKLQIALQSMLTDEEIRSVCVKKGWKCPLIEENLGRR
ncbi:MAG: hypothetical protein NZV14_17010 [Bryobacteraceae bacterium]|nr:hypothetical protein [Bryobacteraceae bacterium]MDW8379863.1 hypothetical protein [Bryobacterales bacterium]